MSIISDIKGIFSQVDGANDFFLQAYQQTQTTTTGETVTIVDNLIQIYGVLEISNQQQNSVSVKPLEQSNFTTDSVQIKPYIITIRGIILPDQQTQIADYNTVSQYIATQLNVLRNYLNGTQLFTLSNLYSFGVYQPLKLFGMNTYITTDFTIPEVTLSFMQVQSTNTNTYSTANVPTTGFSQPQNNPVQQRTN